MYLIILNCSHFLPPPTLLFSVNLDLKDISQEYVTKDQRKSYNPCWCVPYKLKFGGVETQLL